MDVYIHTILKYACVYPLLIYNHFYLDASPLDFLLSPDEGVRRFNRSKQVLAAVYYLLFYIHLGNSSRLMLFKLTGTRGKRNAVKALQQTSCFVLF